MSDLKCNYFEFVASADGTDINFFGDDVPSTWTVSINGMTTSQYANSLTFERGDTVRITYDQFPASTFNANGMDFFTSISGSIPNVRSTNFSRCFYYCQSLIEVSAELFANNPDITSFEKCFMHCKQLNLIPSDIFMHNVNVTNISQCFEDCASLTVNVHIASPNITNVDYFASRTKSKGVIYVPINSSTAKAFKTSLVTYVTVIYNMGSD